MEANRREHYRKLGVLRLLVLDQNHAPPKCLDIREDWIRVPATRQDLWARIATLRARAQRISVPSLDQDGVLRMHGRSVTVSLTEANLLAAFIADYGEIVAREALRARVVDDGGLASRNALDLHIKRIRRRIQPLGLSIRTAWGRGYILESD
jgi:DNA-binding response OmpR family regulator